MSIISSTPETPSIWIMGLSAAGKSTLAKAFVERLRASGRQCVLLDGDQIRAAFEDRLGYDPESRRKQTERVLRLARLISSQGVTTVVAIIHPFESDRETCRRYLPRYFQVYLKCDLEVCLARDHKNVYAPAMSGGAKNVVGLDIPFERPMSSDLVFDSARMTPDEMVEALWQTVETQFSAPRPALMAEAST